jgi:hypothetical protein
MFLEKVIAECGFSVRPEQQKYMIVENRTGRERDLSAAEGNFWADVCQRLLKDKQTGQE